MRIAPHHSNGSAGEIRSRFSGHSSCVQATDLGTVPLSDERVEELSTYWKQHLSGLPVLELPTDRPRPAVRRGQWARAAFSLSESLTEELRQLSRREAVPLELTLLAAFQVLLQRYSGQDDLVVGMLSAGCDRSEEQGAISSLDLVVARTDLSGDPTFRELVQRVRNVTSAAQARPLPFKIVVEQLQAQTDPSRHPVFQATLEIHPVAPPAPEPPGLTIARLAELEGIAAVDLALSFADTGHGLRGVLTYDADLFEAATADRIIGHFQTLLHGVVAHPDLPPSRLPLLPEAERRQLEAWNATATDYPLEKCIQQLFEEQAARTPDAVAATFRDQALTYRELNQRANQLARHLRGLRVDREVLVGMCVERSLEMVVGMLGVLKAGAAYLPLDPAYPQDRLAFMLEDARPAVVLTLDRHKSALPANPASVRCLDRDWPAIATQEIGNLDTGVTVSNLAYVIYTSGSTGRPKGVLVEHRGMGNLALAQIRAFQVQPGDRVLQFASMNFDASVSEVLMALIGGATLCLEPAEAMLPGPVLERLLRDRAISVVTLPPSVLEVLSAVELPALKSLIVAGEACSAELVKRWSPGRNFFNAYGPTEATVCATMGRCGDGTWKPHIGKPMANTQIHVLDKHLQPVPIGVPGELHIGGDGLARGYLHQPELTRAKFIANPFSAEPGSRLYKTGDLVRWLADGNLEFLGRIDHQVKIRGFRIELGEIESLLVQHPRVRQAVVVAREDVPGKKFLAAYVVTDPAQPVTGAELRRYLKENLPDYMVPATFVALESIPRTANGKVDRRALPAPDRSRPPGSIYVGARTPLEQHLVNLWQEILGFEKIGVEDHFFELGGNSIQAAILVQKLQEKLGEYVYAVALFDAPTIAGLAKFLARNYADAVARVFGHDAMGGQAPARRGPMDAAKVATFRGLIKPLPTRTTRGEAGPNPPAVFVLSPPRSGSTLFRVMLAGHPGLFAPPELQLLNFNTLQERLQAFSSERDRFWLDGTIRALMEIHHWPLEQARAFMEACERNNLSVKDFYRLMQEALGSRLFVDKTPTYPLDLNVLERAEADFQNAKFIHLVRHPSAVISSFEEAKLHLVFPLFLTGEASFATQELAELIWITCQQNILLFLNRIPAERRHRVTFEDMVRDPRSVMEGVSAFLGLDFHPQMVDPYRNQQGRMTDALSQHTKMLGDVKFHTHTGIEAKAAERSKSRFPEELLSPVAKRLAISLGYQLRASANGNGSAAAAGNGHAKPNGESRNGKLDRAAAIQALVAIQTQGARPPLFIVHPASGTVNCYRDLARHLGPEQPVYGLQAPGLHGERIPHSRIETMAAHYIDEMRSVQPRGPYFLAGWSMGGIVAFEMAQQFERQGLPVGLLALVDSEIPRHAAKPARVDISKFLMEFAQQCGLTVSAELLAQLQSEERLPFILEKAKEANLLPRDLGIVSFRRLYRRYARVYRANVRASQQYQPRGGANRIILFRASDLSWSASGTPQWDWRALAAHVECHMISGTHYTMVQEPHVQTLAKRLRAHLDEVSFQPG